MTVTSLQNLLRSNLPRGPIGYTGSQGELGFTGSQGEQGPAGGYTGSQGFTGSVGPAGPPDGFTGSQGAQGFTGSIGDIGFTGSQGIQGFSGSRGFTGSQGINAQSGRFVNLTLSGDIAPPRIGVARFYPPEPIEITDVFANLSLAPSVEPFTFVIKKNGVIQGTFSIAVGQFLMTPVALFPVITVQPADYITVDMSGAGGRDLHVKLKYLLL